MNVKEAILHYYPYWIMGIAMIVATLRSEHKDLMRFQPASYLKFLRTMVLVTAFRCVIMSLFPPTLASAGPILQIPLWLTLCTPWEDALFVLPVILAGRFLGESKLGKFATFALALLMQASFYAGHTYEGILSAFLISFYIPVVSRLAKKHGVGTTMACHISYDFITLLTVRLFLGL